MSAEQAVAMAVQKVKLDPLFITAIGFLIGATVIYNILRGIPWYLGNILYMVV